jgi:hypothetical protein
MTALMFETVGTAKSGRSSGYNNIGEKLGDEQGNGERFRMVNGQDLKFDMNTAELVVEMGEVWYSYSISYEGRWVWIRVQSELQRWLPRRRAEWVRETVRTAWRRCWLVETVGRARTAVLAMKKEGERCDTAA